MGIVYRATDTELGRTVAVKTLRLSEYATPQEVLGLRERLMREARAAGHLNHPNIVAVHDIGQEGDTAYIVMEFVEGRTLDDMLAESAPLPVELALRILADAARALDHAHARGIFHRDVKPANIMVQADGGVKIADFGVAKLAWTKTMTETGMIVGSPHFMAPEQLRGEPVSAKTDQFALAGVAYTVLTGRKPFDADTVASLFAKILRADPVPVETLTPGMEPGVGRVLRKAMAKDPKDRFASCTEFVESLRSARFGAAKETPKEKTRRSTLAIAVAAALLMLVAAGAFLVYQRHQAAQAELEARNRRTLAEAPKAQATREDAKPGLGKESETLPAGGAAVKTKEAKKSAAVAPSVKPVRAQVKTNPTDGQPYVWVPPGSFQMGCSPEDEDCRGEEKPAHAVAIGKGFWMGQTEVTLGAYRKFVKATGNPMPFKPGPDQGESHPMVLVTYDQASAYCRWAGGRLPTEAEWEYAARAGAMKPYYSSNPEAIAWFRDNSGYKVHPVGQKEPNQFGLYDMLGNVWEIVADWYGEEYYASSEPRDPKGPADGKTRVARGGGCAGRSDVIRASYRGMFRPDNRSIDTGFRCVGEALP